MPEGARSPAVLAGGVRTTPERLTSGLAAALASDGPSVVVLPAQPRMFAPTHLGG